MAAAVIEIGSGDILALVSLPTYDLNTARYEWGKLMNDKEGRPLINRAINDLYAPGSVVKPLVLIAEMANERIGFVHPRPEGPSLAAGLDRDENDLGGRECGVDQLHKPAIILRDALGGFAAGDVVVAGVKDDHPGFVGQNHLFRIVNDVGNVRTAKAAVDDRQIGKRLVCPP